MSVKIAFLGAARTVTGSQFLVEAAGKQILIDCGMSQGSRYSEEVNHKPFDFKPKDIDAVILTHAHIDHSGRLPKLVKDGFGGFIYSTPPTKDFAEILLTDTAQIIGQEDENGGAEAIFTLHDVVRTISQFKTAPYGEEVKLAPNLSFRLIDAGHVLGSAIIELKAEGKTIIFSGDLGNPPTPLLTPTQIPEQADYVIVESTYGNRLHEPHEERSKKLQNIIERTINQKGVLLMPIFAFEKEQEILFEINKFAEQKQIPRVPVFIDSPLAIAATKIYEKYPDYYNVEAKKLVAEGDQLFNFPGLQMTPTVEKSKMINRVLNPKIIIAGSGMMTGGRILHHAIRYLSDPNSTILFVGYQAAGSLGRRIFDRAKAVRIMNDMVNVRCLVKGLGAYSSHADQDGLVMWLDNIKKKPKRVFVVHGEEAAALALSQRIIEDLKLSVSVPYVGERIEL
ncbi:MAG: hypothetical protein A3A97_04170 [Candidatus Terrybacteria bacterium RIFCSPLOWO2_01_FULL_40_23]|uniref:MBL fold hydrolase n=1 Tax=Candidatus Terrybacteria bacterium RIFCSPLOWO2_01_FULL_40_23 TaxID=1802366 RepID=A0A1G2PQJ3_9BACT|nr:MAG: hypothetical protein A3A97_04170 [Candidatus Terrybacteria bacterium RIFCSPLOWO2_01_FULL_40_23]